MLETLYEKLKAQSGAISKINKEVDELRGDDGNPLDRLRMLEQRFNAIFGEPGSEASFSPFKQQELVNKVEFLGNTVAQQAEVIRHLQKVKKEVRYVLHQLSGVSVRLLRCVWLISNQCCSITAASSLPARHQLYIACSIATWLVSLRFLAVW